MLAMFFLKTVNFSVVAFNAKCDPTTDNPGSSFLGFPNWWKYIHSGVGDALGGCTPTINFSKGPIEFLAIGLAAIDILLYIAGIAAVISIIIAGIQYILAAGATDKITSSRKRIQNSLIGLAIVFVASGLVSFIGNALIK